MVNEWELLVGSSWYSWQDMCELWTKMVFSVYCCQVSYCILLACSINMSMISSLLPANNQNQITTTTERISSCCSMAIFKGLLLNYIQLGELSTWTSPRKIHRFHTFTSMSIYYSIFGIAQALSSCKSQSIFDMIVHFYWIWK